VAIYIRRVIALQNSGKWRVWISCEVQKDSKKRYTSCGNEPKKTWTVLIHFLISFVSRMFSMFLRFRFPCPFFSKRKIQEQKSKARRVPEHSFKDIWNRKKGVEYTKTLWCIHPEATKKKYAAGKTEIIIYRRQVYVVCIRTSCCSTYVLKKNGYTKWIHYTCIVVEHVGTRDTSKLVTEHNNERGD